MKCCLISQYVNTFYIFINVVLTSVSVPMPCVILGSVAGIKPDSGL